LSLTATITQFSGGVTAVVPSESLVATSNYLFSLCRGYNLQAQNIINAGSGGSVSPVSPSLPASPYYFLVSVSSTPMVAGDTTHTFTEFKGYNLSFIRNGLPQSQVSSEPSYFSYNPLTGVFVCSPALVDTELIALIPV
jgi:hypothetical protein